MIEKRFYKCWDKQQWRAWIAGMLAISGNAVFLRWNWPPEPKRVFAADDEVTGMEGMLDCLANAAWTQAGNVEYGDLYLAVIEQEDSVYIWVITDEELGNLLTRNFKNSIKFFVRSCYNLYSTEPSHPHVDGVNRCD